MDNRSKYRRLKKKGEGTFSEVYKVQNVENRAFYAVKYMKEHYKSVQEVNSLKEINVLRKLSPHPNIINLVDVLFDKTKGRLGVVFELMDKNLYDIISGRRLQGDVHLDPQNIRKLAFQLFTALHYIHHNGIFHRDIKPENILVDKSAKVLKLADFGSCQGTKVVQPHTGYIATRWYRAPENLLTDGHYGPAMDIWGAGCTIYELTTLYPLFSGSDEVDQLNRIHRVLGTPTPSVLRKLKLKSPYDKKFSFPIKKGVGITHFIPTSSSNCMNFIKRTLEYDCNERITSSQALSHKYFDGLRERPSLIRNYAKLRTRIKNAVSSQSANRRKLIHKDKSSSQRYQNRRGKVLPVVKEKSISKPRGIKKRSEIVETSSTESMTSSGTPDDNTCKLRKIPVEKDGCTQQTKGESTMQKQEHSPNKKVAPTTDMGDEGTHQIPNITRRQRKVGSKVTPTHKDKGKEGTRPIRKITRKQSKDSTVSRSSRTDKKNRGTHPVQIISRNRSKVGLSVNKDDKGMQPTQKITRKQSTDDSNSTQNNVNCSLSSVVSQLTNSTDMRSDSTSHHIKVESNYSRKQFNTTRNSKESPSKKQEPLTRRKTEMKKVPSSDYHKPITKSIPKATSRISRVRSMDCHGKVNTKPPFVRSRTDGAASKVQSNTMKGSAGDKSDTNNLARRRNRYSNVRSSGYGSKSYSPARSHASKSNGYLPDVILMVGSGVK